MKMLKTRRREIVNSDFHPPSTSGLDDDDGAEQKSIILWSSIGTAVVVVLFVLSDPSYRENVDVILPSRKQRQRIGGVSNGLSKTVKRWFSVDENEPTKNVINANGTIRPPLPSIPEAQMSGLYRSKSDKRVSAHNGEYVEIGADILRRSNIYNPLDGINNPVQDPYDALRKSRLLVDSGDYPQLRPVPVDDNRINPEERKIRLSSSGNDEYLEPTDKQRHSYIEVLPEHREMCKKTKK
ncbi:hypothetical protein KUTeg_020830 [Tegillarca granosa]|uniref:Uncharacterized protein n=1 Tax=Tegillarca granosa TaxID=220873 RepID=A0ABQ9EF22_TEGGR|nr:hypothetical protein KUTeg_020830 [Tegillarca granosa]